MSGHVSVNFEAEGQAEPGASICPGHAEPGASKEPGTISTGPKDDQNAPSPQTKQEELNISATAQSEGLNPAPTTTFDATGIPPALTGPYLYAPKSNGDHWEKCLAAVEKYDNDMCKSWKEEIDTLLVFVRPFHSLTSALSAETRFAGRFIHGHRDGVHDRVLQVAAAGSYGHKQPTASHFIPADGECEYASSYQSLGRF
jgi:hypothetical protein